MQMRVCFLVTIKANSREIKEDQFVLDFSQQATLIRVSYEGSAQFQS